MNLKEYMIECERTCPNLESDFNNELHMAIGASTEAGELLDAYKKTFAYGSELDSVNVGEEIADIFWYLINLCRIKGIDPEEIMDTNIKKLKQRYPNKFSKENAENRNLKKERNILEKNNLF